MTTYYLTDIQDRFVLYAGSSKECEALQDIGYGGLAVLTYDQLDTDMIDSLRLIDVEADCGC